MRGLNKIKAIIFDKDGTLINFHSIWIDIAQELVERLVQKVDPNMDLQSFDSLVNELKASIGLHGERLDSKGILACGTTDDIVQAFKTTLVADRGILLPFSIEHWLPQQILELTEKYRLQVKPTADLPVLLAKLKEKGLILGVATADDYDSTMLCFQQLDIVHFFDEIITGDRCQYPKPHASILKFFCEKFDLDPSEVVVVGDTIVDLQLAINGNAGLGIGVLTGASSLEELNHLAQIVIDDVSCLLTSHDEFIWAGQGFEALG